MIRAKVSSLLEEDLDYHFGDATTPFNLSAYVVTSQTEEPSVLSVDEPSFVGASLQDQARNTAIIDCGASESIVGSFMLQDSRTQISRRSILLRVKVLNAKTVSS